MLWGLCADARTVEALAPIHRGFRSLANVWRENQLPQSRHSAWKVETSKDSSHRIQKQFPLNDFRTQVKKGLRTTQPVDGSTILEILIDVPCYPCKERDDALSKTAAILSRLSCVGIIKLHLKHDTSALAKLGMMQYLRTSLDFLLGQMPGVQIMKAEDERIFLISERQKVMLQVGIVMQELCKAFSARNPALSVSCSMGMDWGEILILTGDFYGDAVNIASKLGEDNASPGDVSTSQSFLTELASETVGSQFLQGLDGRCLNTKISGVEISYSLFSVRDGVNWKEIIPGIDLPSDSQVHEVLKGKAVRNGDHGDKLICLEGLQLSWTASRRKESSLEVRQSLMRKCAMLQSDMSGFTRLTRKYGIMHFLSLVVHCRRMYAELLEQYKGRVIKYDGDNVISVFPDAAHAAHLASAVSSRAEEYNRYSRTIPFLDG